MYIDTACNASTFYDFRKDFSAIATPGLHRYLRAEGYDPDEPSNRSRLIAGGPAKDHVAELSRGSTSAQDDHREFGASADVEDWCSTKASRPMSSGSLRAS